MMTENKKNQGFKIRKIKRDIEHSCDNAIKHFELFVVFFIAGLLLWHGMHAIFSAGIDSWKAGFLVTFFLSPMYVLIYGSIGIFLLKRRMRRENKLREGGNNASY